MADDLATTPKPEDAKQELRQELIKHLSSEIATESEYIANFRVRMAFTCMTGPFIVMGTLLVAFKGPFGSSLSDRTVALFCGFLGILYLCLSLYIAGLEHHSDERCKRWRKAMVSLANGNVLREDDLLSNQYPWLVYPLGFLLMIAMVALLAFLITQAVPSRATHDHEAPTSGESIFLH